MLNTRLLKWHGGSACARTRNTRSTHDAANFSGLTAALWKSRAPSGQHVTNTVHYTQAGGPVHEQRRGIHQVASSPCRARTTRLRTWSPDAIVLV